MNGLTTRNLLLSTILAIFFSNVYSQSKIDSLVIERFQLEDSVECFLIFNSQVEAIEIDDNLKKEQKAEIVYNHLSSISQTTQSSIIDSLIQWNIPFKSFYIVNAIKVKIDSHHLESLTRDSAISTVVPDFTVAVSQITEPTFNVRSSEKYLNWAIEKIGADQVWKQGYTGRNVVIGGQDTGYEWDHYLLKNKYRGWISNDSADHNYHWYDAIAGPNPIHRDSANIPENTPCGFGNLSPCDDNGHGNHTMGIALGSGNGDSSGIAPGAQWIGVRVMDRGYGQLSTYLSGLQWFLAPTDIYGNHPRPELAPDVIINSWSCPLVEGCRANNFYLLDSAINRLTESGVFVVVSAGNEGRNGCESLTTYPAIFENSFTVGASTESDSIADFSNRSPNIENGVKPEVVAPGVGIQSAFLNGQLKTLSGTSMSGPVVAGVVALIIEANPSLAGKVDKIRKILIESTYEIEDNPCGPMASPNSVYGYGRIDAFKAVQLAQEVTTHETIFTKNPIVKIYPNPIHSGFNIDFGLINSEIKLDIININGSIVFSKKLTNTKNHYINIEFLKNGMYFVRLVQDQGWTIHKIIKI
ncbi:S8/S53 family peptidase [Membranihabitans marinus]|uniref:S8/S53 family peptidase n=1 Tax=Membranihabitans marinus TaxID=1227546 RepID=UPI001F311CA7|nr:S8/S53 family peptidase [Membranihabitans marinus]